MADLNKVFLMGRLTRDPELRRTTSGIAVAELGLATTRSWLGRDGERKEETLFVDVTVWDRQAETCCQYLKKGSGVHVDGSLKMDTWEDKTTGEKRSKIRVHADRVQFLDRREPTGMSGMADDEYGSATREAPPRRSAPSPDPRSGSGNSNSNSNGPGPARPYPSAPGGPAPRRPISEPEPTGDEDEDIPF